MNDQERAAMQMALEALETELKAFTRAEFHAATDKCVEAITALREALAQPQVASKQFHEWAVTEHEKIKAQPQDHSEQHLNMVQGEWVDLTDDEAEKAFDSGGNELCLKLRAVIYKFKKKNMK